MPHERNVPAMGMQDPEKTVRERGFPEVTTWSDAPNAYYKPHSHDKLTTHLILKGSMEVRLPERSEKRVRHGPGEWVDIPANTSHEVWVGDEGATMVIGE